MATLSASCGVQAATSSRASVSRGASAAAPATPLRALPSYNGMAKGANVGGAGVSRWPVLWVAGAHWRQRVAHCVFLCPCRL